MKRDGGSDFSRTRGQCSFFRRDNFVGGYSWVGGRGSLQPVPPAKNLRRLEGKDYIVKDGDIMYFRSGLRSGHSLCYNFDHQNQP